MLHQDIEFAKAVKEPFNHLWLNKDWLVEEKLDGWRLQLQFGGGKDRVSGAKRPKDFFAITRNGEDVSDGVKHLYPSAYINNLGLTVLDGELIPHNGKEFHSLASIRSGKSGNHKYCVFDVLMINGNDIRRYPLATRLDLLATTLPQLFYNNSFVVPVARTTIAKDDFLKQMLADGGEGVILKNMKSSYGAANSWIKVKRNSTVDVLITGFVKGYNTPCGAVNISVCDGDKLKDVGKVGIVDSNVRDAINKDPRSFVGKVIEIKCLKYDEVSGKLREPIFIKMRNDLSFKDASWDKLQKDLSYIEFK